MADWLRSLDAGQWYEADGVRFEMVGIDIGQELILVQHFDGALEEFDFENWMELSARPSAPPEDWSGALDLEPEDYGIDPDQVQPQRWDGVMNRLDELN